MSQMPPSPPPQQPPRPDMPPAQPDLSQPMPPGGRISRGWHLLKISWGVVMQDKELLVLPIISFVAIMIWWAIAAGIAFGVGGVPDTATTTAAGSSSSEIPPAYYVVGVIAMFVSSFIAIFFNAAIIGVAMKRLEGQDAHISDGLKLAASKLPKIIGWALLTTTVGVVLRSLEERAGFIGAIVLRIIGAAWAIITFFVVPVLLFEEVGVFGSVKRSVQIFKQKWGEQFTGNVTIGLVVFLLALPVLLVGGLLFTVAWPLGVIVLVVGIGALMVVSSALTGVFNTALYRYATTGQAGGGFSETDLAGAFKPKKKGVFGS